MTAGTIRLAWPVPPPSQSGPEGEVVSNIPVFLGEEGEVGAELPRTVANMRMLAGALHVYLVTLAPAGTVYRLHGVDLARDPFTHYLRITELDWDGPRDWVVALEDVVEDVPERVQ